MTSDDKVTITEGANSAASSDLKEGTAATREHSLVAKPAPAQEEAAGETPEEAKPFAVFPDAASFQKRMAREAEKLVKERLKALGLESEADLQKAAEAVKAAAAQKSDIEKAQETIAKLQEERDTAVLDATERLIRAEVLSQATTLGFVHPELAYRNAELAEVKITDEGKVEGVKEALTAFLKQYPDQAKPAAPSITATKPASQTQTGDTDAERRKRYFGGQQGPFWQGGGTKITE